MIRPDLDGVKVVPGPESPNPPMDPAGQPVTRLVAIAVQPHHPDQGRLGERRLITGRTAEGSHGKVVVTLVGCCRRRCGYPHYQWLLYHSAYY